MTDLAARRAPERVWLQPTTVPYDEGGEWTWCWHNVGEGDIPDIEYVPAAPPVESEEGLTPAEAAECASRVQRHEPLGLSAADHDQLIQKLRRIAGRKP